MNDVIAGVGLIGGFLSMIVILYILSGLRIVKQYEHGVLFFLGKYVRTEKPGLKAILPGLHELIRIDMRQRTIDLKPQEVITKDQVNLRIDGVVFYKAVNAAKYVINVENIASQLDAKASSELKEIIGNMTMTDTLTKRDKIAQTLKVALTEAIEHKNHELNWGITVIGTQINNVDLPDQLVRAMAKQAEAEREKEARKTKAEGEAEAAKKFREASNIFENNPEALKLRELQTYQEIGAEQNSLMIVIPQGMAKESANMVIPLGAQEIKKARSKKK